jgi:hypothetical protein
VALSIPPTTAGSLTAVVTTDGASSGVPVQVATASVVTITGLTIPAAGTEGSPVNLSATATDPVSALTYTWTVTVPPGAGSNLTLTGATASFVPPVRGNYGVSLTVSDSDGGSASRLAPAGLQEWYRGEGNAVDSQSGVNGTVVGGVTYAAGEVGQAFSFDGSTGYVQLPANFLLYPISGTATPPLSFETWFRTSAGGVILGQQPSPAFGAISGGWIPAVYVGTDGHLYAQMFWGGAANPVVSPGVVNDNQFHHVAVTYDGTTESVYLDGVAIGTRALTQVAYAGSYNYQLGLGITYTWPAGNGGWFPFKGLIDEASFYSRALSAAEVQSIVADGSAGKSVIAVTWPPIALVKAPQVNGNSAALAGAQRSMVDSVMYTFNHAVTLAANAFTIALHAGVTVNGTTGQTVGTVPTLAYSSADGGVTWVVTFSGAGVVNNSIADGVYDLTLHAAAVSDANGLTLTADRVDTFFRLYGDTNGDGTVNNTDAFKFKSTFLKSSGNAGYLAYLDYNGDGTVNNTDAFQLKKRFLTNYGGFTPTL